MYVIRLAVRTEKLDDTLMEESATNAPHRIFLCDSRGRLISRLTPGERMVEMDGELRVDPAGIPPEVSAALASPEIQI